MKFNKNFIKWRHREIVDWRIIIIGIATLVILGATVVYLDFSIRPSADPITLHYTISFGTDLIGPRNRIFWLPGFGILVVLVNSLVALSVIKRERPLGYFLVWSALLFSIFIFFASWALVMQNH